VQQSQVEAEEEFITNKLMKRLEQLKQEKQILANEVSGWLCCCLLTVRQHLLDARHWSCMFVCAFVRGQ
jgi:hypothetical protein